MADCECIGGCPFFNDRMKDKESLAAIYKKKYCQGDFADCARYMVFKELGKEAVPASLYPNMRDAAMQLLPGK